MAREARQKVEPAVGLHSRDPQDPLLGPVIGSYESVSELLRRTREQYGEDLLSVAEALRIRHVHLQAIEEGRFRDLPGSTYALGFVRSYAEFLGLDGPEIVERFKEEVAELNRKTQLVFPTPVPEGKVPGGALILISVVLLAAAYGAWTYFSRPGSTIADLIPPVPEHLQSLALEDEAPSDRLAATGTSPGGQATPAERPESSGFRETAAPDDRVQTPSTNGVAGVPRGADGEAGPEPWQADESEGASAATSGPAPSEADPATAGPSSPETTGGTVDRPMASDAATRPALGGDELPALPGPEREQAEAANPAAPAPFDEVEAADQAIPAAPQLAAGMPGREAQVYGADNEDARIVLRALQDSWVQVRDAEDSLLLTRVLREGDEYRVPNQIGLTLLTGNAGGIEVLVDGRRLPPLGPVGAVRRDIALDPQMLVQGRFSTD